MSRRLMHLALLVSLVVGLVGGGYSPAAAAHSSAAVGYHTLVGDSPTTEQVVEAFRRSGLEVGSSQPMTRDELDATPVLERYGAAPAPIEGTRFVIPSIRQEVGGRVLRYGTAAEALAAQDFFRMLPKRLSEAAATKDDFEKLEKEGRATPPHAFVRDTIVVLLTYDLPYGEASSYEKVLQTADAAISGSPATPNAPSTPPTATVGPGSDSGSAIAFGKAAVSTEYSVTNPIWNLDYLLGLRQDAPGGRSLVAVLATNVSDQVKSFEVKATVWTGGKAIETHRYPVTDLLPGRSRPVLLEFGTPIPARYDSTTVEVARMVRESATTARAEGARQIALGEPRITSTSGDAVLLSRGEPRVGEASVEVSNRGTAGRWAIVWLALVKGDEVVGVVGCEGPLAAGQSRTASLWTMWGTAANYDQAFVDVELHEGMTRSGIDCSGVNPTEPDPGKPYDFGDSDEANLPNVSGLK